MELDNLSYLSLEKQVTDFPVHFHETYCISFIHKGIERLDLGDRSHFGEAGSVTVTHPYEVHSQPVADKDFCPGFDTIYLSEDLIKFYTPDNKPLYLKRKIEDPETGQGLLKLRAALQTGQDQEQALKAFVETLLPHKTDEEFQSDHIQQSPWLDEVKGFIDHNISAKINLEELASIANINKFGFSKTFKTLTGMSPINYVLMSKAFAAKKRITPESNLTLLSYEFDFTDLAHFSKTFKRFVGISPKEFQSTLK